MTIDQGRQLKRTARLKAARCRTCREDSPHMNGPLESLQVMVTEIGKLKQSTKQDPGAWSDQYLAGLGQGLQARRQVWRVSDKRELTRGTLSDQVTDNHEAACNADAYLKSL